MAERAAMPQLMKEEDSEELVDEKKAVVDNSSVSEKLTYEEEVSDAVIEKNEDVAVAIISAEDDPTLPVLTFRSVFLGIGLSAFTSVLATIYTFKPQNASVSQLFCLIIAYVLGTAMHSLIPSHGWWRYLNPGPFNIKEHSVIVMMSSTASQVAIAMEIIAALDLYYGITLNPVVAIFQIFATQMIGYGIAGLLRNLLVYPTHTFYPTYISVVNLLQSLHFGGLLNHKKRRYFWIVFVAIFCWEWIPQYPFPLLTAISIVCLVSEGRGPSIIRNLFGAGSSNEGIGLLSFGSSWTLITQGNPLVWPWQTQLNSYIGMALGYIVLTTCYYSNLFNGRDLVFMSTSLFSDNGSVYDQSAVLTPDNRLNESAIAVVGLPRYATTYALSQMMYNFSLGAAFVHVLLYNWKELKKAFGGTRLFRNHTDINDPHFKAMQKYREVPMWAYMAVLFISLAVGIGCSYATGDGTVLLPAWAIIVFTIMSAFISVALGFICATTGFQISVKYAIQIIASFILPGQPIGVMYANLYGNSTSFQVLYMLQDLKLGQYTKVPPRWTFAAQMTGSIVGSVFNYSMMKTIVSANREVLLDPTGTRIWSGWIIQQYNSAAIAMGALGKELFTYPHHYWLIPFAIFVGLFMPIPFWIISRYAKPGWLKRTADFIHTPIILQYIGYLPYSVNGQWWTCLIIGFVSQYWARTRKPKWFKKYNYLTSAALDGGSQVVIFILSFAVFGASGSAVDFPFWWGNPDPSALSADRCAIVDS